MPIPALKNWVSDRLCLFISIFAHNSEFPAWRRCGFSIVLDPDGLHPRTVRSFVHGPDQDPKRAAALVLLQVLKQFPEPVHVHPID